MSEMQPKGKICLHLYVALLENLLTTNCCVYALRIKHRYICTHTHTPWFWYCKGWPIKYTTWKMDRYPAPNTHRYKQSLSEGAAMREYQGLLVFPSPNFPLLSSPLSPVTSGDGVIYSRHSAVITSRTLFVLSLLVGGMLQQGMRWMSEW